MLSKISIGVFSVLFAACSASPGRTPAGTYLRTFQGKDGKQWTDSLVVSAMGDKSASPFAIRMHSNYPGSSLETYTGKFDPSTGILEFPGGQIVFEISKGLAKSNEVTYSRLK